MKAKLKINNDPGRHIERLAITTLAIALVIGALFIIVLLTGGSG